MVTILARSRWTSTAAKGSAFVWSRVRGIVCHYPAMGASVGVLTQAQETVRLRGWRNYHVRSLGWADIGYNYCVTQAGRIYSLRGDRVGAHAVGHNSTTVGVLFMVGDNEPLTKAAQASFRALRSTLRKRGAGSGLWGHTQMSGNSTRCPGPYIMADIRSGVLKSAAAGATVGGGGTSAPKPSKPAASGKLVEDGRWGTATTSALQRLLNAKQKAGLKVDGRTGPATWKALQRYLGHPVVDGLIEHQSYRHTELSNGISPNGWVFSGRKSKGSKTIKRLQAKVGVTADGVVYSGTVTALQKAINQGKF